MAQPDKKQANLMLEEDTPALLKMDGSQLRVPRITRERAFSLTQTLLGNFRSLLPLLSQELSAQRVQERTAQAENLERYAFVLYAADLNAENPLTPAKKKRRYELIEAVRDEDAYLFDWAWPLFRRDPQLLEILIDIRKGRGYRDDAEDVLRLVKLLRDQWVFAKGKTPVTEEYLTQAEKDATEFLKLLDLRDSSKTGSPRDLLQRAYTRWYLTYDELCQLGRYLLRHDPEAAEKFPGVFSKRSPQKENADNPTPPTG